MSIHNPPCRTGSDHLDREVDAGDVENEGLEAFVARFIAEREEEARAEVREQVGSDWAPGEITEVYGR